MINKQEAIEKLESRAFDIEDTDLVVGLTFAKHTINQIDEPEKPTIPQYVADWIEENKDDLEEYVYSNVQIALSRIQDDNPMHSWLNGKGIGIIVDCIRNGYEVEKEKLYTVEIPNPNGDGYSKTFLGKFKDGKVELCKWSCYTSIEFADNWKQEEYAQLTESEIKEDFDWAWQFAEEVEE